MYKPKQRHAAFRFRRFCRAKWAAYSSMHREVTIGRLASRVANCGLRKQALAAGCLIASVGTPAMAQTDDREARTLPEVEVSIDTLASSLSTAEPAAVLTASDFRQTSVRSIADLVALLPGVDLRARGGNDVQADLSMRGGTFDQMLLLLNGVNLTDAQTGHHTLDIPIDIAMVERVELLSPAQLMARGTVAFCGAVNIVVSEEYRDRLLVELGAGSHGTAKASLLATKALGRWALTTAAAYNRSDGYMPNTDYRHGSLFLQGLRHGERSDWHLQLGGQFKDFGSQAFYSTAYPDQYEATRTLVASATNNMRLADFNLQFSLYGRLHRDRFELFRDGYVDSVPTWYGGHNHHLSSLSGASLRAVRPLGVGEWVAGAEVRREGIRSNVLGTADSSLASPYTHSAARTGANLYTGYGLRCGRFGAEATALGTLNSQFGFHYGLAAGARYDFGPLNLRLSAAHTFRLPTFTDLYYTSATQQADPDLNAERSTHVELSAGTRTLRLGRSSTLNAQLTAYYRAGSDIIGWVRPSEDDLWLSMNHSAVDAFGIDVATHLQWSILNLQLSYSYCHIASDSRGMLSSSALDHLRHRLASHLMVPLLGCRLKVGLAYRYREGVYVEQGEAVPYGGTLLVDAAVERDWRGFTFSLEGRNLLDTPYRDLGGVPQPGATLMAGVRWGL